MAGLDTSRRARALGTSLDVEGGSLFGPCSRLDRFPYITRSAAGEIRTPTPLTGPTLLRRGCLRSITAARVCMAGLEPAVSGFVDRCLIQFGYTHRVSAEGVEPTRDEAPEPKPGVSTSSTTPTREPRQGVAPCSLHYESSVRLHGPARQYAGPMPAPAREATCATRLSCGQPRT